MYQLLDFANNAYNSIINCKDNKNPIDCYGCLSPHFYTSDGNEKYDCIKGLAHYIMDYGPCYASSTYHFLDTSKILDTYPRNELNILSLGCGFSPDYYAFTKYIQDKGLAISFNYTGMELHEEWNYFQQATPFPNKTIIYQDVLKRKIIKMQQYDLIFLDKFFSSLSAPDGRTRFLSLISTYLKNFCKKDVILIFKDVNDQHRGRDIFDETICPIFSDHEYYKSGGYGFQYKDITNTNNIFTNYPSNMAITPKYSIMKEIFFVYKNIV